MRLLTLIATAAASAATSAFGQLPFEPGWPVTTGFSVSPSATVAQLDGDPQLEIVIASQDQFLYVYNHDGTILPGWPKFLGNTLSPDQYAIINSSPAVADIDGDGELEIVVGSNSGKLYAFEKNGALVPGFPYTAGYMVFSTPAIGDIDGDGMPEIVFGDNLGRLNAITATGVNKPGFPYLTPYAIRGCPALGDLDGDGVLDIVVPSEASGNDLYAVKGDGTNLPGWPRDLDPNLGIYSSPALGDIDLDGHLDVVVGLRNGKLAALSHTGADLPGWPVNAGYSCLSSPTLANLDEDPQLEIVVGFNDSKVVAYNHDGTPLPGWPVTTSYTVISSPSVGDIDGDGRVEVVVGENTGKVYAFETDGTLVAGFPLLNPTYTIYSSPLLADFDLDGRLELLLGCNDTKIYAWDFGEGTHDPELLPWPEWRGDAVNCARVHRPAYVQISGVLGDPLAGATISLDANVVNLSQEMVNCDVWVRVFEADGPAIRWPSPIPLPITLAPEQVQHLELPLAIPCAIEAGAFRVQVYLGSLGQSAFDVAAIEIEVQLAVTGDIDGDNSIGLGDFALFAPCLSGPGVEVGVSECVCADFENDLDVDAHDFAWLQTAFVTP